MSFIYQKLRDRKRTYIKEKVKSRDKYTCSEFPNDPVEKTGPGHQPYVLVVHLQLAEEASTHGTDNTTNCFINLNRIW